MSNINTDLIRTLTSIENSSVSLSDKESLVSSAYNTAFKSYFKLKDGDIIRVANCDAYFKCGKLVLLIEYKLNTNKYVKDTLNTKTNKRQNRNSLYFK